MWDGWRVDATETGFYTDDSGAWTNEVRSYIGEVIRARNCLAKHAASARQIDVEQPLGGAHFRWERAIRIRDEGHELPCLSFLSLCTSVHVRLCKIVFCSVK